MQTQFFEIYRAGLKSAADMMTATLESARRIQQQQLDTLQSAIEDQARSVRELAEVKSVDELMALQTRLAGSQLERSVDLWARLWRAAGDNQLAIIGTAQAQLGPQLGQLSAQLSEGLREVSREASQEQRAA
jgi:phasin family protein